MKLNKLIFISLHCIGKYGYVFSVNWRYEQKQILWLISQIPITKDFRGPTNKSNSFAVVYIITNLLHLDCSPIPSIIQFASGFQDKLGELGSCGRSLCRQLQSTGPVGTGTSASC